jgi:hypothetical protein
MIWVIAAFVFCGVGGLMALGGPTEVSYAMA